MLLKNTIESITDINRQVFNEVLQVLNEKNYSQYMGLLAPMAAQYAAIVNDTKPDIPKKCMIIMSADHGVAKHNISAYPVEATIHMTRNYLVSKGAGANALANHSKADMVVVDVGINGDLSDVPGLIHKKIALGTKDFSKGPAMSREEAVRAIEIGIEIVTAKAKEGYSCFSIGEMGIGNTAASAAIVASFGKLNAHLATGRGTGISDARLDLKRQLVEKALEINKPNPVDGIDVLQKVGGFEIGGLVGVLLGAAALRCCVIIDGFNASAAALIARSICPLSREYTIGSHLSAEQAHHNMLKLLDITPYINLKLRLGEATGASLGMVILDSSIKIIQRLNKK